MHVTSRDIPKGVIAVNRFTCVASATFEIFFRTKKHVFSYFLFGFEGRMWDLIVSVPDHCLSFYFRYLLETRI